MEEWRQCGRWLIDCKVLPPNHRVVWPSAAVFDLAQALRDGVLLCQMLHNLSPGSVDLKEINFRPQMSQLIHDSKANTRKCWVPQEVYMTTAVKEKVRCGKRFY
eukprot:superscaffoldBa00000167_g2358